MPGFTPARRWQAAYRPFKNRPLSDKIEETLERTIKGALVGLPHVRQLPAAGNCLHLPHGMPQRAAQRTLRRLDPRTLLRGRNPPVHLVQDLRTRRENGQARPADGSAAPPGLGQDRHQRLQRPAR